MSGTPVLSRLITWLTAAAVAAVCLGLPARVAAAPPRYSGVSPLKHQAPLTLVGDDLPPSAVLYPRGGSPQSKQAAGQLADYLSQISGVDFAAGPAPDPLPSRAVLVGEFPVDLPEELSREGFVIRTDRQRLHLCGGSPRATLYAVFCLLEEQLGCRWWSRNEERVPRTATIQIPAQDTHVEPAFRVHDLFNKEGQSSQGLFVYKRRGASGTRFTAVHNLCPMLKPHAEQHPEFLPMNEQGQRKFNNIHMNYTAEGMAEVVADELGKQVARRGGNTQDYLYVAGMGDWYGGMDLSPASQQIYEQEAWTDPDGRRKPGYSATLLRMVNRAAQLLERQHPGAVVATHAYMSLEAPPSQTIPRGNVVIEIPRLRHDTVRSIEESDKNQSFRRNLDRWCELAPGRVYVWEYGANFNNFLKPFPCLRSIAANLKYYHRAGVAGVRIQGNYVSTGGDLAVLKNYVWGKLLWDPTRDVDGLIDEFCRGYYGPASHEMLGYVALIEGSVRGKTPVSADEFEKDFSKWLRPDVVQKARRLLDGAAARTKGDDADPYHRRVMEARVSLEAFDLWRPGEFVARGEKLVRADLGGDTLPRARQLLRHCRDASPREWGDGRAYRMGFLTMHGGPLPTLRSGAVSVQVAPLQGGELRRLRLGDAVAIERTRDVLAPAARLYELKDRGERRVGMEAELGIAHWGSSTKQIAGRTVELTEDGTLRVSGDLRLAERSRQRTNSPAVRTEYYCDDPRQVVVQWQNEEGSWTAADVELAGAAVEIPQAGKLRIARRDRKLVVLDSYHGPAAATGTVQHLAADKDRPARVAVTVRLGEVKLEGEQAAPYVRRDIQVHRIK